VDGVANIISRAPARTCPSSPAPRRDCDLPNPADELNPPQSAGNYQRTSIARGCSPTQVMPFGFQLHYARYVDPNTGTASEIILAPSDQVFGWDDSYSTWDLGLIAPLAAHNNPAKTRARALRTRRRQRLEWRLVLLQ